MKPIVLLVVAVSWFVSSAPARTRTVSRYQPGAGGQWELSNGVVRAVYALSPAGAFTLRELGSASGSVRWTEPPGRLSSPIHFALDGLLYTAGTPLRLVAQATEAIPGGGERLVLTLDDLASTVQIRVVLEMYPNQAVLRQRIAIRNLRRVPVYVTDADFLRYRFAAPADALDLFHIDQWDPTTITSFQLHRQSLGPEGGIVALRTGADARDIAWYAFRDGSGGGLFAGLEFDGRAQLSLARDGADGSLLVSAIIPGLHHRLEPGQEFLLPAAFLGPFQGDWDEAGYLTQRFMEAHLAQPMPENFPWVSWDSWGHGLDIDEAVLRQNAEIAARLGIELFVVDLGWARHIGDWRADPARFPSGLRAISDYVHQLGMKFGLHFAPAEASSEAPVLLQHTDWTASETDWYFGAVSLCLAHKPVREWIVGEAVRMIDEYNVDYIVQDGENMVKRCRRSDHTHHEMDSNWSNSVEGINWVVREIQRLRPGVLWENCEDGGHMLTFQMVQQYVTSIINDATGALDARKGAWGATYPFTPRYTSRYMPEQPSSTYVTRSHMFGGPWHFMNRLTGMSAAETDLAVREIGVYKRIRSLLSRARVYHLLGSPAAGAIDAIQAYDASRDASVVIVTRDGSPLDRAVIRPQGLRAGGTYRVRFEDAPGTEIRSGRQLAEDGVEVVLPSAQSAEIVYIDPVP